jgi:hypothetical protein
MRRDLFNILAHEAMHVKGLDLPHKENPNEQGNLMYYEYLGGNHLDCGQWQLIRKDEERKIECFTY